MYFIEPDFHHTVQSYQSLNGMDLGWSGFWEYFHSPSPAWGQALLGRAWFNRKLLGKASRPTYPLQPGWSGTSCRKLSSFFLKTSTFVLATFLILAGRILNNCGPLMCIQYSLIVPMASLLFIGSSLHFLLYHLLQYVILLWKFGIWSFSISHIYYIYYVIPLTSPFQRVNFESSEMVPVI